MGALDATPARQLHKMQQCRHLLLGKLRYSALQASLGLIGSLFGAKYQSRFSFKYSIMLSARSREWCGFERHSKFMVLKICLRLAMSSCAVAESCWWISRFFEAKQCTSTVVASASISCIIWGNSSSILWWDPVRRICILPESCGLATVPSSISIIRLTRSREANLSLRSVSKLALLWHFFCDAISLPRRRDDPTSPSRTKIEGGRPFGNAAFFFNSELVYPFPRIGGLHAGDGGLHAGGSTGNSCVAFSWFSGGLGSTGGSLGGGGRREPTLPSPDPPDPTDV